ncbi:TRAP transporter large permease [Parathalassolituus penaei]|uniref:TRAP transporter large permease protein n=1 Tax=Parathalassolituus penaei TaxID=2997323 RepID=A0A9X3EP94_9GAMM|nr:TRAP transporter large permease [Parathalassolituus penaei]MCY0966343.1 TRAP transporter large permease [Parathalassolituus penaei]
MSNTELALVMIVALLVLMSLRVPIALSMMACGAVGYGILAGPASVLNYMGSVPVSKFSSDDLAVVPLFILMGELATRAGITRELFRTCNTWIGELRGGLAMAAVAGCAAFGAICGSSLATASTMGKVALPEMKSHKYDGGLAAGALAAGGTLGILIPPSMVLIILAVLTEQNIAKMFLAAFVPGIMAALGYMLAIAIYVRLFPKAGPAGDKTSWKEKFKSTRDVWHITTIFLIVLGGIYGGIFTPNEAAAVGVFLTAVLAFTHGKLKISEFKDALIKTAMTSAMIFFIVLGADLFSVFIAMTQLPNTGAQMVLDAGLSPYVVLIVMLISYLILGCFMDSLAMILLTIPIYFPVIVSMDFGMSPDDLGIWFGVIALVVVEVGLITPPVGMNVFIIQSFDKDLSLTQCFKGVVPFLLSDFLRVALMILFPAISLTLVHMIG